MRTLSSSPACELPWPVLTHSHSFCRIIMSKTKKATTFIKLVSSLGTGASICDAFSVNEILVPL